MNAAKACAIIASAYNVCGPRSGNAARPADVLQNFPADVLRDCLVRYAEHVKADRLALFTPADVLAAAQFIQEGR